MRVLLAVYSLLLWTFIAASSAVLFFVGLVVYGVTRPFDPDGRVQHLFSCAWAQLYFFVNPMWRLRIEGREHLPWRGPAVLVSNHESLGDILVLFGLFRPFKWVSKASVFKVPFVGWNMRLNRYIGLVRGDRESIARMMREAVGWLKRGVPVMLFPEGTRSPDGSVRAFKDGAFQLSVGEGVPVVPIALDGTAAMLPKHGWILRRNADCRVRVLPPVDPAPFEGDVAALRDHVRERIVEAKAVLAAERVQRAAAEPG